MQTFLIGRLLSCSSLFLQPVSSNVDASVARPSCVQVGSKRSSQTSNSSTVSLGAIKATLLRHAEVSFPVIWHEKEKGFVQQDMAMCIGWIGASWSPGTRDSAISNTVASVAYAAELESIITIDVNWRSYKRKKLIRCVENFSRLQIMTPLGRCCSLLNMAYIQSVAIESYGALHSFAVHALIFDKT